MLLKFAQSSKVERDPKRSSGEVGDPKFKYMMYHESLQANLFMGASAPLTLGIALGTTSKVFFFG